jgi:hypothetical protein
MVGLVTTMAAPFLGIQPAFAATLNTTTTLTTSPNPSQVTTAVTLTATVSASTNPGNTGTVAFKNNGTTISTCSSQSLSNNVATCNFSFGTTGTFAITAAYSGGSFFGNTWNPSTSNTVNQLVSNFHTPIVPAPTGSPTSPGTVGQTVTYSDTISGSFGTPTGTATFLDGGTAITCTGGSETLDGTGTATCSLTYASPGSHTITVSYSGDTQYKNGTSSSLSYSVKNATTTTLVSSINPSVTGQAVTYTATIAPSSATGTVNFTDGGTTISGCGAKTISSGSATCAVTYTSSGSHTIQAVYSSDANNFGSSSSNLTQTVNKANTTTVVTSTVNPSVVGQSVTYTATVTAVSPGTGTPTGSVAFSDNSAAITGCASQALNGSGVATCIVTYSSVTGSPHPISGAYSGDGNYNTSSGNLPNQTVNQANTTATVVSSANPALVGQGVTYTATVSVTAPGSGTPTGSVTFKDAGTAITCDASSQAFNGTTATCILSAGYASPGSHPITAVYSGDTNYKTATTSTLTESVFLNSSVAVVSSVNPSVVGQQVTYTATVSGTGATPTGTVTFKDGATTICSAVTVTSGQAICNQTYTAPSSTHSITASYSGDSNYNPSTSSALTQTVNQAATTTALASSASPSVSGQSITYTATVAPVSPGAGTPTGTVTFKDASTTITCSGGNQVLHNVSGSQQATCTLTYPGVGSHSITAAYPGDTNFTSSTSSVLTQTVNQAATTTALASNHNPSVVGQPVTYTATVSVTSPGAGTPTGSVTFADNGTTISCGSGSQAFNGTTATCVISTGYGAPGAHPITAAYSGDTNYIASTSSTLTQTVNQAATTTAVVSSANPSLVGNTVTYTATVSVTSPGAGAPTGSVTFADNGSAITCGSGSAAFNGSTATCVITGGYAAPGSHPIVASYSGDSNFLSSNSSTLTQTVNKTTTATAVVSSVNPAVVGQPVTYTATVTLTGGSSTLTGTVTFKDNGTAITCGAGSAGFNGSTATCVITAGYPAAVSHPITATYNGDADNGTSTSSTLTQNVSAAATTTGLTSSGPAPSLVGQPVSFTATVSSVAPGSGTPTGTVTVKDGATAICTVTLSSGTGSCSGGLPNAGSRSVTATYNTDGNFATSTSSAFSQTVNQASTTTALASSPNPAGVNTTVTYTATVSAVAPGAGTPTGTVQFFDGGSSISCTGGTQTLNGSGVATCSISYGASGLHNISASYQGDSNYIHSTSSTVAETIDIEGTVTALSSSANPSTVNAAVTYTARIQTAGGAGVTTGSVAFTDNGTTISGCGAVTPNGSGQATCSIAANTYTTAGTHPITATYTDGTTLGSSSASLVQTVNAAAPATPTSTAIASNSNDISCNTCSGRAVTYTATVTSSSGSPTGTVAFTQDGTAITGCSAVTVSSGTAACSTTYNGQQTHVIVATYTPTGNFAGSSAQLEEIIGNNNIGVAATATSLASSGNPSSVNAAVTYTATVTANGVGVTSGTVAFTDNGTTISGCGTVTVNGSGVATCAIPANTYSAAASHPIKAAYGGTSTDAASSESFTQVVSSSGGSGTPTSLALVATPNPSSGSTTSYTATVTSASGTPTGTVSFTLDGASIAACSSPITLNGSGVATCSGDTSHTASHTIVATYAPTGSFAASSATIILVGSGQTPT